MKNKITTSDDRAMILDSYLWPQWPYLPLKRGDLSKEGNTGLIYSGPTKEGKWHVFHANLFALPKTYEEFKALPQDVYDSVDALLADGWVVD